jgi:HEAT repeat protein
MWAWRARMLISDLRATTLYDGRRVAYPQKRSAAAKKLGVARVSAAVQPLIEALQDDYVAEEAAIALSQIGDPRAIEPLCQRLKRMTYTVQPAGKSSVFNEGIGRATGQALASFASQHPKAMELLVGLLTDKNRGARDIAAKNLRTLAELGAWQPRTLKEHVCFLVATGQAKKATELGDPAIEPLAELARHLAAQDREDGLAYVAMQALASIHSPRNAETLILFLSHDQAAFQHFAAEALGKIGDPRAIPHLARLTKAYTYDHYHGAHKSLADTAREVLVRMGPPAREAIKALTNDSHPDVREWAQSALTKL